MITRIDNLETQEGNYESEIMALKSGYQTQQAQIQALQAQVATQQAQIQALQAQNTQSGQ
jgi:peptidoglycan hydrolase CwlO-like protein